MQRQGDIDNIIHCRQPFWVLAAILDSGWVTTCVPGFFLSYVYCQHILKISCWYPEVKYSGTIWHVQIALKILCSLSDMVNSCSIQWNIFQKPFATGALPQTLLMELKTPQIPYCRLHRTVDASIRLEWALLIVAPHEKKVKRTFYYKEK